MTSKTILCILFTFNLIVGQAQPPSKASIRSVTKEQHESFLRQRRAELMTDSLANLLFLDEAKKDKLLKVNLSIEKEKHAAWKSISDRTALKQKLQAIEVSRNELYHKILSTREYIEYTKLNKKKYSK